MNSVLAQVCDDFVNHELGFGKDTVGGEKTGDYFHHLIFGF